MKDNVVLVMRYKKRWHVWESTLLTVEQEEKVIPDEKCPMYRSFKNHTKEPITIPAQPTSKKVRATALKALKDLVQ